MLGVRAVNRKNNPFVMDRMGRRECFLFIFKSQKKKKCRGAVANQARQNRFAMERIGNFFFSTSYIVPST